MNAFSLFGELKVGTSGFENSLFEAEKRLNQTERAITQTERRAQRLGQTSATTGRSFDKLSTSVKANRDRMQQALDSYSKGEISQRKLESVLRQTDTRLSSVNSRLKDHAARLSDLPSRGDRFAASLERVNSFLTLGAGAVVGFAVKTAASMDSLRRGLASVAGSAEETEKQLIRLREVAKLPGLGFQEAIRGSINLQAAGLSASTAERALMAFGNALAIVGKGKSDLDGVSLALTQIAGKSRVSAQEINQLSERVPQIRAAMQAAFGTADTEALDKLGVKPAEFINKIITELEKLPKATTSVTGSFENMTDALEIAIEPVGRKIVEAILPSLELITTELDKKAGDQQWGLVGQKIGNQIGVGIGVGLRSTISAETVSFGGLKELGNSIAQGFNADGASTLIQQFFNKVGAEIQRGIVDITALVLTPAFAVGTLGDKILEGLGFTVDATPNVKLKEFFRSTQANIAAEYEKTSVAILQKSKASFQKVADDTSMADAVRTNARKQVESIEKEIEAAQKRMATELSKTGAETVRIGIAASITRSVDNAVPEASKGGQRVGGAVAGGMALGISSGRASVVVAAIDLARSAWQSAKNFLGIESPSKVFHGIGVDTVQGFVDGINASAPKVSVAIKKAITQQLKDLKKELTEITAGTGALADKGVIALRFQVLGAEQAKSTLEDLIRLRFELNVNKDKPLIAGAIAERELAGLNKLKDDIGAVVESVKDFGPEESAISRVIRIFSDEKAATELKKQADALGLSVNHLKTLAKLAATANLAPVGIEGIVDVGTPREGTSVDPLTGIEDIAATIRTNLGPPPELKPAWEDFFGTFRDRLRAIQNELPTFKQALGDNLLYGLGSIGDVVAGSLLRAEASFQGFFKNLVTGFGQLAQQLIADLVRIQIQAVITKLAMSLIGAFGGSAGGGGGIGSSIAAAFPGGYASGGFTGMGDKWQPAGIVHKGEYVIPANIVKKIGVRFFDALVSNRMPAMAGGGYMQSAFVPNYSGASTNNSTVTTNAPVVNHFHFHANQNGRFSQESADQATRRMVAQMNRVTGRAN